MQKHEEGRYKVTIFENDMTDEFKNNWHKLIVEKKKNREELQKKELFISDTILWEFEDKY